MVKFIEMLLKTLLESLLGGMITLVDQCLPLDIVVEFMVQKVIGRSILEPIHLWWVEQFLDAEKLSVSFLSRHLLGILCQFQN